LPDSGSNVKLYQKHANQTYQSILLHGFHCPYDDLQCNSVIKLHNEHIVCSKTVADVSHTADVHHCDMLNF